MKRHSKPFSSDWRQGTMATIPAHIRVALSHDEPVWMKVIIVNIKENPRTDPEPWRDQAPLGPHRPPDPPPPPPDDELRVESNSSSVAVIR
jgi:hypothetical protein